MDRATRVLVVLLAAGGCSTGALPLPTDDAGSPADLRAGRTLAFGPPVPGVSWGGGVIGLSVQVSNFATGDVDCDGSADVTYSIGGHAPGQPDAGVAVRTLVVDSTRKGRSQTTIDCPDGGSYGPAILQGRLDRGCAPDLLVVGCEVGKPRPYLGSGDGTFRPGPAAFSQELSLTDRLADVTGDGLDDLVLLVDGQIAVRPGLGDGTFGAPVALPGVDGAVSVVVAADVDGDKRQDLVLVQLDRGAAQIAHSNGGGGFRLLPAQVLGACLDVVADVDGDGVLDLLGAGGLCRGRGDGTFAAIAGGGLPGTAEATVTADFDRDGRLDVAARTADLAGFAVWPGTGDGGFGAPLAFPVTVENAHQAPVLLAAPDLDGDGLPDLLARADAFSVRFLVTLLNESR